MNPEFVERRVGPPLLRKVVGISRAAQWNRLRETLDRPSWRSFGIAMGALAMALFLALYSGAAAEEGHLLIAGMSALSALALAGWVALTIVPALARRTPLGWLSYQIDYKVTREGMVYIVGIFVVGARRAQHGKQSVVHGSGLPARGNADFGAAFAGGARRRRRAARTARTYFRPAHDSGHRRTPQHQADDAVLFRFARERRSAPKAKKNAPANPAPQILDRPVYFPHIPHRQTVRQNVELTFPRRGVYRQDALGLRTKFPFGFLQKTRRVDSAIEAVVYPRIQPTEEFYEILPLVSGELESYQRGRGNDLYAIRDYQFNDSARHVDWKASARTGALQVKEYAREDERRVMLVFDPYVGPQGADANAAEQFERAVTLCAGLAWHFYEINSVIEFRSAGFATPRMSAGEIIYDILRYLASVTPLKQQPGKSFLDTLGDTPDIFKIVLTSHPRGSIPSPLWNTAYFLFVSSL